MTASAPELAERIKGVGPPVVVAEAGVNHNGDLATAHALIDAAAVAGADVVKFQTFVPGLVVAEGAPSAAYQLDKTGAAAQMDFLTELVLPTESWGELHAHAQDCGLAFLSTAFDAASLELLEPLDPPFWKVPSGELTNLPFIRLLAGKGKPLVISTGMSTLDEVATAVDASSRAPSTALLHCVSAYPAPVQEANLRAITTLRETFGLSVGWSDHTRGSLTAIAALALGATIFEKHLTLDRNMRGPDHEASADPQEFAAYVDDLRSVAAALGGGEKKVMPAEIDVRRVARRSWYAAHALPAGHVLTEADVVALRPAGGIGPDVDLVGRRVRRPLEPGAAIAWDDLEADGA